MVGGILRVCFADKQPKGNGEYAWVRLIEREGSTKSNSFSRREKQAAMMVLSKGNLKKDKPAWGGQIRRTSIVRDDACCR